MAQRALAGTVLYQVLQMYPGLPVVLILSEIYQFSFVLICNTVQLIGLFSAMSKMRSNVSLGALKVFVELIEQR